jgi:hypothetical protein
MLNDINDVCPPSPKILSLLSSARTENDPEVIINLSS